MPGKLVTLEQDVVIKDLSIDARDCVPIVAPNAIAGVVLLHQINIADGATGNVDLAAINDKFGITDVVVLKRLGAGGAGDTIQIRDENDNNITDAMSINLAADGVVRNAQLFTAFSQIRAGGTIRVRRTKASVANVACTVLVFGGKV